MALKLKGKPAAKANKIKGNGPSGADKVAGILRDLVREQEQLAARVSMAREELLEIVNEHREATLKSGVAENTVTIPTPDGGKVLVIYQERYKGVPSDNIPALEEAFGSDYSLFVEQTETVTLAKHATLDKLKAACGKHYDEVLELLEVNRLVVPRKGAYEHIATAYRQGKPELAEDLTTFVESCVTSPQVRT